LLLQRFLGLEGSFKNTMKSSQSSNEGQESSNAARSGISPYLILFASGYFAQSALRILSQPLALYMKDELGMDPQQMAGIDSISESSSALLRSA
jgi:hypothetical protein